jgi:uncharacterized membrane protein YhaH (DUF805 family)
MAHLLSRASFRFLYREDEGTLGRAAWWTAIAPPTLTLFVMTAIWLAIMPAGARDLARDGFFDARSVATYAYLLVFAFATLIGFVMIYNVTAKRLRDRGRPPALAGLLPFALFFAGAMRWLAGRAEGAITPAMLSALDVAALAVVIWTLIECGVKKGRSR